MSHTAILDLRLCDSGIIHKLISRISSIFPLAQEMPFILGRNKYHCNICIQVSHWQRATMSLWEFFTVIHIYILHRKLACKKLNELQREPSLTSFSERISTIWCNPIYNVVMVTEVKFYSKGFLNSVKCPTFCHFSDVRFPDLIDVKSNRKRPSFTLDIIHIICRFVLNSLLCTGFVIDYNITAKTERQHRQNMSEKQNAESHKLFSRCHSGGSLEASTVLLNKYCMCGQYWRQERGHGRQRSGLLTRISHIPWPFYLSLIMV